MLLANLISGLVLLAQAGQTQVYQCPLPNGRLIIMYPKDDFSTTYIAESIGVSKNFNFISKELIISALDRNGDDLPDEVTLTSLGEGGYSTHYNFPKDLKNKKMCLKM